MHKKILIQILLLLIIIIISWVVYLNYFKFKEIASSENKIEISEAIEKNNLIKKLEYESSDDKGRKYIIKSDEGSIDENNSEIIFMENVTANIILADGSIIYISSKEAIYNNKTYNTNFLKNVKLDFLDHNLFSQNLDLIFDRNKIEVYNDLVYKNLDLTMIADKVEIDMLTKYSKIFTFDDNKIKIEKINK